MENNGYNPQTRPSFHQIPVITTAGSITGKFRANGVVSGAPGSRMEHATLVTVLHQSGSFCNIQLRQSASNITGTGTNLGGQLAVVPGGAVTATVYPNLPFVEVVSVSGAGVVRMQLDSRIEWERMSFSKTDAGVPAALWKAQNVTPESSLPD